MKIDKNIERMALNEMKLDEWITCEWYEVTVEDIENWLNKCQLEEDKKKEEKKLQRKFKNELEKAKRV